MKIRASSAVPARVVRDKQGAEAAQHIALLAKRMSRASTIMGEAKTR